MKTDKAVCSSSLAALINCAHTCHVKLLDMSDVSTIFEHELFFLFIKTDFDLQLWSPISRKLVFLVDSKMFPYRAVRGEEFSEVSVS